jgi:23S rRNA pseudouridine2605 synthase
MKMRINRYLAQTGWLSRRAADSVIQGGRVTINSRRAVLGDRVDPEQDEIRIDGKILTLQEKHYLALYKPKNVLTTLSDPCGRRCVRDLIPGQYRGVFPAGRLDFDAEGLIILTNDGDLAHAIHHPSFHVPKVYIVALCPKASDEALQQMAAGIILDGRKTRPAFIEHLKDDQRCTWVKITLRQGLKNQIKRMAQTLGLQAASIERIAIGPVDLKGMQPGDIRRLTRKELVALHKMLKNHKVT